MKTLFPLPLTTLTLHSISKCILQLLLPSHLKHDRVLVRTPSALIDLNSPWPASPGELRTHLCPWAQELYLSPAQGHQSLPEVTCHSVGLQLSHSHGPCWSPALGWLDLRPASSLSLRDDLGWVEPHHSPCLAQALWAAGPAPPAAGPPLSWLALRNSQHSLSHDSPIEKTITQFLRFQFLGPVLIQFIKTKLSWQWVSKAAPMPYLI